MSSEHVEWVRSAMMKGARVRYNLGVEALDYRGRVTWRDASEHGGRVESRRLGVGCRAVV